VDFTLYRLPIRCGHAPNVPEGDRPIARHGGLKDASRLVLLAPSIVALFLILWILGFSLSIGENLIDLLLVVALMVFVINLVNGRRGAV
jgi:hypothetical protein